MALEIDDSNYNISDIEQKYSSLFSPCLEVSVEGTKLGDIGALIGKISVDTSTVKADSFSFNVINAYDYDADKFKWVDQLFTPGKSIEIKMGYGETKDTVFEGVITAISFCFIEESSPEVLVSGMDVSFKMMKGIKSYSWENKKYSDIVTELAAKYTSNTVIDATEIVYGIVEQSRMSDYQFIAWMAEKSNFEFFLTGKTLFFRKPNKKKEPKIELKVDEKMLSLQIDHDIGDQIGAVTVRGWDHKKKEEFQEKIQTIDKLGSGKDGAQFIRELAGNDSVEYIYTNEDSQDSASKRATMILNSTGMKLVSGSGEWIGIPKIMAGKYLQLSGAGDNLDKLYYIISARHIMDSNGYKTTFELGGNDI